MANETTNKKFVRPKEERIAELDKKIAFHEEAIKKLQERKERILNPKPRVSEKAKIKTLLAQLQESGMTIEDITEKLGLNK